MTGKLYTGINIQYPISRLILQGKKTVETRTYPIPNQFIGKKLAVIETPGPKGAFKARVVAIIVFGESFKYENKRSFNKDSERHCVLPGSPWSWEKNKPKWGWPILFVKPLEKTRAAPKKKGIVYTRNISL